MYSYLKPQEQGIFATFYTTEKRNIDCEIAKVENLKTQKIPPTQLKLEQFLDNQYQKIICAFFQRQNTITRVQKKLCRLDGLLLS